MPEALRAFLQENTMAKKIHTAAINSSTADNFRKRFFTVFNGLQIVKFLNAAHEKHYTKIKIETAASDLLKSKYEDCFILLDIFRKIQRQRTWIPH